MKRTYFLSIIIAFSLIFSSCGLADAVSFYENNSHVGGSLSVTEGIVDDGSDVIQEEYVYETSEAETYAPTEEIYHATSLVEKYAYDHITDNERTVYDEMYACIMDFSDEIRLSTKDKQTVKNAYEALFADNGGLFWLSGYTYHIYSRGDEIMYITFTPEYTMSKNERDHRQVEIDAVVYDWLEGVAPDASEYDKVKYVYQTLISNVEYEINAPNSQNIISTFLNRATVCQGYADAVSYMLEKLGISSAIITGEANGEPHAWNLVRIDGDYYYLDATWGNSRYLDMEDSTRKFVNFAYLNVTSEELSATHTSQMPFVIPEAVDYANNYYRHEGLYFDDADMERIGEIFGAAYNNGDDIVSIKLGSSGLFHEVSYYFLDQGHIAEYCPGLTGIAYLSSEEMGVLTLLF